MGNAVTMHKYFMHPQATRVLSKSVEEVIAKRIEKPSQCRILDIIRVSYATHTNNGAEANREFISCRICGALKFLSQNKGCAFFNSSGIVREKGFSNTAQFLAVLITRTINFDILSRVYTNKILR